MKTRRIIPRLDIKGPNVVKGIHLEGLRVVGKPAELAKRYYEQGADEIIYLDVVASLYGRNSLLDIIKETISLGVFIPLIVGGGIRSLEDIKMVLRAGADKVAINTAAIKNPEIISKSSQMFGSQCIVGSIEAKSIGVDKWEAYMENGREKTGLDVLEWAKRLVKLGAGELLITSIDNEGTQKGFEENLIQKVSSLVSVPVIACGGAGSLEHISSCLKKTNCQAISLASILHYQKFTITEIKENLEKNLITVRPFLENDKFNNGLSNNEINPTPVILDKKPIISIIDYGLGNLKSVIKGFNEIGCQVKIINTPKEIIEAESIVLPGVGSFEEWIKGLKQRNLIDSLNEYVQQGKPLLGICLGSQLLLTESQEFGVHKGLNIVKGKVIGFKTPEEIKEEMYYVPHIGWNNLFILGEKDNENYSLNNLIRNKKVYFAHSFYMVLENKMEILSQTSYGGQNFCSMYKKGNIYGCQFHPEKSGEIGLKLLKFFSQQRCLNNGKQ
jgi:imidazole glycerol phosphate synthase glutamine amidotransferase subunit